jgi:hypothetical protein
MIEKAIIIIVKLHNVYGLATMHTHTHTQKHILYSIPSYFWPTTDLGKFTGVYYHPNMLL